MATKKRTAKKPAAKAPKKTAATPKANTRSTAARTKTTANTTSTTKRRTTAAPKPVERPQSTAAPVKARLNMLEEEYEALTELKQKLDGLGVPIKRGELLRAGIQQLTKLTNIRLKNAVAAVPVIKKSK